MKGYRFYLEFPTSTARKRSGRANTGHSGNVVAAIVENGICPTYVNGEYEGGYDSTAAVLYEPNSPTASTMVTLSYLRTRCKRIPESLARKIHPAHFAWLDSFAAADEEARNAA